MVFTEIHQPLTIQPRISAYLRRANENISQKIKILALAIRATLTNG
jgi:hypothetical protein